MIAIYETSSELQIHKVKSRLSKNSLWCSLQYGAHSADSIQRDYVDGSLDHSLCLYHLQANNYNP